MFNNVLVIRIPGGECPPPALAQRRRITTMRSTHIPVTAGFIIALFMGGFLTPRVQTLQGAEEVDKEIKKALEKVSSIIAEQKKRIDDLERVVKAKDNEIAALKTKVASLVSELEKAKEGLKEKPKVAKPAPPKPQGVAFLGVEPGEPGADERAKLNLKEGQGVKVITVQRGSPADKAGIQPGDVILSVAGKDTNAANIRDLLRGHAPGDQVDLVVLRGAEKVKKSAKLADRDRFLAQLASRPVEKKTEPKTEPKPEPKPVKTEPVVLGLLVEEDERGPLVLNVEPGKTGAEAKMKEGDVLLVFNGKKLKTLDDLSSILGKAKAGQELTIEYQRKDTKFQAKVIGAGERGKPKLVNLTELTKKAVKVEKPKPAPKKPATLGVQVWEENGVRVAKVNGDSAAAAAGIQEGDIIASLNGKPVNTIEDLKELLQESGEGATVSITVLRNGQQKKIENVKLGGKKVSAGAKPVEKPAEKPAATPKKAAPPKKVRGVLGITAWENEDGKGLLVSSVNKRGPADQAGVRKDDIILKINGADVKGFDTFEKVLKSSYAGDVITLLIRRGNDQKEIKVTLGSPETSSAFPQEKQQGKSVYLGASLLEELGPGRASNSFRIAINDIYEGSPAARAGLRAGDEILSINHQTVRTLEDIGGTLGLYLPGETVQIRVLREGKMVSAGVVLGEGAAK